MANAEQALAMVLRTYCEGLLAHMAVEEPELRERVGELVEGVMTRLVLAEDTLVIHLAFVGMAQASLAAMGDAKARLQAESN